MIVGLVVVVVQQRCRTIALTRQQPMTMIGIAASAHGIIMKRTLNEDDSVVVVTAVLVVVVVVVVVVSSAAIVTPAASSNQ